MQSGEVRGRHDHDSGESPNPHYVSTPPHRRHPGEGRGPASGGRHVESWLPAFAGMTA